MLIGFVSSSWTALSIHLFLPASSMSASPTRTSFGWLLTSHRRQPAKCCTSKTHRCSSRSRRGWGFEAFFTPITTPLARSWLRSDCRYETRWLMHPDDQRRIVEYQVCALRGTRTAPARTLWDGGSHRHDRNESDVP